MNSVNSLNSVIERELMLNQFDGGQKLKQLLATAREFYRNMNAISALKQAKSNNTLFLPDEVITLGKNIQRLENELRVIDPNFELSDETKEANARKR